LARALNHQTRSPGSPRCAGKIRTTPSPAEKDIATRGRKPVAIVVDVGDHHRANLSVAWARSDLGSLDIKANKAGIARAEPILDAAEDLSVFVDRRARAGGADRRWGGLPMTNPKADQRARMSQLLPPGANVARPSIFTAQRPVSP
jgi:NAD(P)-dependent dehydrogenase (short-subunit alcohol dehydrogenase family)